MSGSGMGLLRTEVGGEGRWETQEGVQSLGEGLRREEAEGQRPSQCQYLKDEQIKNGETRHEA